MIKLVQTAKVEALSDHRLALSFSDGSSGILSLADIVSRDGEMVRPLRDPAFFSRVFLEMGTPTWPNGFDIDSSNARETIMAAGGLKVEAALA